MKKRLLSVILGILIVCGLTACGTTTANNSESTEHKESIDKIETVQTYEIQDITTSKVENRECKIEGKIENGKITGHARVTDTKTRIVYEGEFVNGKLDGIVTIEGYYPDDVNYSFRAEYKDGIFLDNMVTAVTTSLDFDYMVGLEVSDTTREQLHIYEEEFKLAGTNTKEYENAIVIDEYTTDELNKHIGEIVKIENGSIYNFRYHTPEEIGMKDAAQVDYGEDKKAYAVFSTDIYDKFNSILESNGDNPFEAEVYGVYIGHTTQGHCSVVDGECVECDFEVIAVLDYKIK